MILNERNTRQERILAAAGQLMTAARTAPKSRGFDNLEICLLVGDQKSRMAEAARAAYQRNGLAFFLRDADSVDRADAVILLGYTPQPLGLDCGRCGYATCAERAAVNEEIPCSFNEVDLGIAMGSMAAQAADLRLDSRVMYSVASVCGELDFLPGCRAFMALPISISSKSPFYDRQPK